MGSTADVKSAIVGSSATRTSAELSSSSLAAEDEA
jgi:hypothetical protein